VALLFFNLNLAQKETLMDGGNVWGYLFLFSLVAFGLRKMWGVFDAGGKIRGRAQDGVVSWIGRLFKL
jgi:hypothetical protein